VHPAVKFVQLVYVSLKPDVVPIIPNVELVLVISVKMLVRVMLHVSPTLLLVVILLKLALVQVLVLVSTVLPTILVPEIQPIVV